MYYILLAILPIFMLAGIKSYLNAAPVTEKATFAGGCFWCMEPPFEQLDGVSEVNAGYSGGKEIEPNYKEVSAGKTGHMEAIQIVFDPKKVTYEKLGKL